MSSLSFELFLQQVHIIYEQYESPETHFKANLDSVPNGVICP